MLFKGILPALMTPYDNMGGVCAERLNDHIGFLLGSNVNGLYICGVTGDSAQMNVDERKKVAEIAVAACKKHGRLSFVHVGSSSTRDSLLLAEHAASIGADAISAMPIANTTPFQLKRYYEDIASVGLPLLIYYIPSLTHRPISLDELLSLIEVKNVFGLKFSDCDLFFMKRLLLAHPDTIIFNGNDEIFSYGVLNGAVGGIGMTYNVFPKLYIMMLDKLMNNEASSAMRLQNAVCRYIDYSISVGIKQAVEYTAGLRSAPFKCFRGPFCVERLIDEQKEKLCALVDEIDEMIEIEGKN